MRNEQDKAQPIAGEGEDAAMGLFREAFSRFPNSSLQQDTWLNGVEYGRQHRPATDWDAFRDKFFKEHTELKDGVPKICTMPMDIFNFFKNELTK